MKPFYLFAHKRAAILQLMYSCTIAVWRVTRPFLSLFVIQHLCQRCNLHAFHDERHVVFECPAMQCVRDRYPALLSPAENTMQLFMWQRVVVGVAHYVQDYFKDAWCL